MRFVTALFPAAQESCQPFLKFLFLPSADREGFVVYKYRRRRKPAHVAQIDQKAIATTQEIEGRERLFHFGERTADLNIFL